jgi:hypothetical protein
MAETFTNQSEYFRVVFLLENVSELIKNGKPFSFGQINISFLAQGYENPFEVDERAPLSVKTLLAENQLSGGGGTTTNSLLLTTGLMLPEGADPTSHVQASIRNRHLLGWVFFFAKPALLPLRPCQIQARRGPRSPHGGRSTTSPRELSRSDTPLKSTPCEPG